MRLRTLALLYVLAAGVLAGCSQPSPYDAERSVTVTETVNPGAAVYGKWAHIEGDSRTVMNLGDDGRGDVYVHTTLPDTPGVSAQFPFSYTLDAGTVELRFDDGSTERFEIVEMSAGAFQADASEPSTWSADGVWVRTE